MLAGEIDVGVLCSCLLCCRNPVVGRATSVQCWGTAAPHFTEFESLSDPKLATSL